MSRILYDQFTPHNSRSASALNALYDLIEAASADVDQRNLAEEGIDETVCAVQAPFERVVKLAPNTRANVAASAAFTTFLFPAPTPVRSGALGALLDGEILRIRSQVKFETSNTQAPTGKGIPDDGAKTYMQHAWNNGVATVKVFASDHRIQQITPNPTLNHATFFRESYLVGPIANIAFIELQYRRVGGVAIADRANFTVDKFRRVRVV